MNPCGSGQRLWRNGAYRGPHAMFLRAGFEPYREIKRHLILRKMLA